MNPPAAAGVTDKTTAYSATAISLAFSFFSRLMPTIETNDEYAESKRNLVNDPFAEPLG